MDTEYTAENYMVNANEYELVYFMDANDNENYGICDQQLQIQRWK